MHLRYLASLIVCLAGANAMSVRAESDQDSEVRPTSPAADRYNISRFRHADDLIGGHGSERNAVKKAGRAKPRRVVRVQHSTPPEEPPLPDALRLAQSDFLDDLLNENRGAMDEAAETLGDNLETPLADPAESRQPATAPLTPGTRSVNDSGVNRQRSGLVPGPLSVSTQPRSVGPTIVPGTLPDSTIPPSTPPRRRNMMNQPYTLGDILDDEDDQFDCLCEQEFCELMWQCNGGRNLPWHAQLFRNFQRTYSVVWQGTGSRGNSPMMCYECSYRRNQGHATGNCPHGQGGYGGMPYDSQGIPYETGHSSAPSPGYYEPTPAMGSDAMLMDQPVEAGLDSQLP